MHARSVYCRVGYRWVSLLGWLGCGVSLLWAQSIDSLPLWPPPSLGPVVGDRAGVALPPLDQIRVGAVLFMAPADTPAPIGAGLRLQLGKIESRLRQELPEMYEKDGKNRLLIHIPWREDDLDIPFPRGLLPAPVPPPFLPEVAWQRSLILPGWGQAYNRGYWKIPIFYLGYAGAGWWINFNQQQYVRFRRNYYCAAGVDPCAPDADLAGLDAAGLRNRRNQFRQARDYGIIILAGWHILQVVEAYVDAHLKNFDVSEDLSLLPMPVLTPPALGGSLSPGLGLTWTF